MDELHLYSDKHKNQVKACKVIDLFKLKKETKN